MTSPTFNRCVISVSSERTLVPDPAFGATCGESHAEAKLHVM